MTRIGVGLDGSNISYRALEFALRICKDHTEIVGLHVAGCTCALSTHASISLQESSASR